MSWGNNDKGFGFALSLWFIVASVIQAISVVFLTEVPYWQEMALIYCSCGGLDLGV